MKKQIGPRISVILISVIQLSAILFMTPAPRLSARENTPVDTQHRPAGLTLATAVVCETIGAGVESAHRPINAAVVFPISIGRISCLTLFDSVPERTVIFHNWFRKDILSTRILLSLQPPRWTTYSSIHLREADKGPWRVEIRDKDDRVLKILRFSITD